MALSKIRWRKACANGFFHFRAIGALMAQLTILSWVKKDMWQEKNRKKKMPAGAAVGRIPFNCPPSLRFSEQKKKS
jgi:hypothetical protein